MWGNSPKCLAELRGPQPENAYGESERLGLVDDRPCSVVSGQVAARPSRPADSSRQNRSGSSQCRRLSENTVTSNYLLRPHRESLWSDTRWGPCKWFEATVSENLLATGYEVAGHMIFCLATGGLRSEALETFLWQREDIVWSFQPLPFLNLTCMLVQMQF